MPIVAMELPPPKRNVPHGTKRLAMREAAGNAVANRGNVAEGAKVRAVEVTRYCVHLMRTETGSSTKLRFSKPRQLCGLSTRTATDN